MLRQTFRLQCRQMSDSPRLPTRPVRPIRWTYSSMVPGRSKLMTCFTLQISSPRAATLPQHTSTQPLVNQNGNAGENYTQYNMLTVCTEDTAISVNGELFNW